MAASNEALEAIEAVAATAYTVTASDHGKLKRFTSSSAVTVTVDTDANRGYRDRQVIFLEQAGTGAVMVAAAGGVTVNAWNGDYSLRGQYGQGTLIRIAANTWGFYQAPTGGSVGDASASSKGIVELATASETTTGTDATRAVTPDGLAGSEFGERAVQIAVVEWATDVATGDGKAYFHVDSRLAGMNLVDVHAEVITAGTTGTTDIQIHNATQAADMLSTKLTVDSGETGSDTAAAAAVIDAANDDVAEHDLIRIDVDAVSTTAPKGLIVTLGFRLP